MKLKYTDIPGSDEHSVNYIPIYSNSLMVASKITNVIWRGGVVDSGNFDNSTLFTLFGKVMFKVGDKYYLFDGDALDCKSEYKGYLYGRNFNNDDPSPPDCGMSIMGGESTEVAVAA